MRMTTDFAGFTAVIPTLTIRLPLSMLVWVIVMRSSFTTRRMLSASSGGAMGARLGDERCHPHSLGHRHLKEKGFPCGALGCIKIIPRKSWFFAEEVIKTECVHIKLLIYMHG